MNAMRTLVLCIPAALLLFLQGGCGAPRQMAKVISNIEAEQIFLSPETNGEYTFYAFGPEAEPVALLALDHRYRLESRFWFPLKPTEAIRKDWAALVREKTFRNGSEFRGKKILSPEGETVGFVLSSYHRVTAWFAEPGSPTVTIPPPELAGNQPIPQPLERGEK